MSKLQDFYDDKYDKNFDNETQNYDLERYPFDGWILSKLQEFGLDIETVEQFTDLHNIMDTGLLTKLTKFLTRATSDLSFRQMVNNFIDEYIRVNYGADVEFMVQRYVNIRIVFPNQDKLGQMLFWHQGVWVGSGTGIRNIWMPMTTAYAGNTMQIVGFDKSRQITEDILNNEWSHTKISEVCEKESWPVELKPGQAHLFTQLYVHGNIPNRTNVTRVSMDCRVLLKGEQYFKKLPGGYFRLFDDLDSEKPMGDFSDRFVLSYSENNSKFTSGIPVHLQRFQISEYCNQHGITIKFEQIELNGLYHLPTLCTMIEQDTPDDLLMFSIYALPDEERQREEILKLAVSHDVSIHFVNENIVLRDASGIDKIQKIIEFAADSTSPIEQLNLAME